MRNTILLSLFCVTGLCTKAQKQFEQIFENTPVLHGDSIVFPITLINAFPFISGEVNGVKGKFMFDTGNRSAIDLNDNLVRLPEKKTSGKGIVGSGQSFVVNINDTIAEIKFNNGYTYRNLLKIKSANYDFLQNRITPDCIGYIGYDFFKGYLVKLDYLRRKIIFYKNTEQRKSSKDFLKGEKVLSIIDFEIRKLPNHPLVNVRIGNVEILGAFDTGQYGSLQVQDDAKKRLISQSLIIPAGKDGYENDLLTINNIIIGGKFKTQLKGVMSDTFEDTEPERRALRIAEPHLMNFGYRFLDQYKTVWDYEGQKIYILEK
ncbi:hypothetical protein [Pedobacter antarcticus]|uniref:hypothetical protein n=1 Tax=Pedobacter antarcticus TaxID=34086 RepID=UPI00293101C5|nr:hypothetical protein [Pedobacter antarcticus]